MTQSIPCQIGSCKTNAMLITHPFRMSTSTSAPSLQHLRRAVWLRTLSFSCTLITVRLSVLSFSLPPPFSLSLPLSLSLSLRLSLSSFPWLALHALNPPSLSLSLANPHVAGYHLGEHGEWEKKSNFDLVVRVPLQIHVPWLSAGQGVKTGAIVELVDIFPTIAALAGLPAPLGLDGEDRSALLSDPMGDHGAKAAFHQYPACGCDYDETQPRACFNKTRAACNNTPKNKFNFMGYTMRSPTARYTAWFPWNQNALVAEWTLPYGACVCLWFATRVAA